LLEIGFSNYDSVSHRPISEHKRLKFAQPADLPVQQAVMVTNLKTAKALRARRRLRSAPRMVLFLAVHEGASRGHRPSRSNHQDWLHDIVCRLSMRFDFFHWKEV